MADRLIFSLQAPPFPIFPSSCSSLRRRCGLSRGFLGGARSSQLHLANCISPSQSSSSSSPCPPPEKLELVSTTQIKDGVHVFRFADASEIKRKLEIEEKERCLEVEKQQHAKIAEEEEEEASEVSRKQRIKDGHTLVDLDHVKKRPVDSSIETGSEKEDIAAPASISNVIKIKDRKRVRSPTKKKKETVVLRVENKAEAEVATVSSIVSVSEALPTSSTEETVAVSKKSEPINEIVEPLSSEVMEKASVNEVRDCEANCYQQLTENSVEVQARPRSSTSQHRLEEVASVSTIELDDNLDAMENAMRTFEAEENLVVEPTITDAVIPDEPTITTSEAIQTVDSNLDAMEIAMKTFDAEENLAVEPTVTEDVPPDELIPPSETHHSVDEIAENSVIDISEVVNDGGNVALTTEDEVTVSDTTADNGSLSKSEDVQLPAPETVGPESIEPVSGREEVVSKAFYLDSGFASIESPIKALAGREDAYFISHNNWLGVADGVSQWSFDGIARGTFAQELISNCQKITSDETVTDPVQVLHKSVNQTKSPGSSTALIARLDNNALHVANIGDSGFIVIRNGTVLQNSSPMFHHFCFPFQITQGDDVLKLTEVYHVNLEEGDVIVTATDGLFDNLYETEIVSIVCRSLEQSLEPQEIAELVAGKAQEVGRSETERTPFADAAKEEGYDGFKGGKLDAVTVIVSLVKPLSL